MLNSFKENIDKLKLNLKDKKVLIAVSGGVDSVVLTHLCYHLKINFSIAHMNYQLRGVESDEDEKFVNNLANELDINIFNKKENVGKYLKNNNVSIQMAARALRYSWFDMLMNENNIHYLFTAHHADDDFETTLFNFCRGTGIKGMRGILPKRGYIVRPLLPFLKNEILDYANKNNLKWRNDSSNYSDDKYARNKLRLKVIPELKKLNNSLLESYKISKQKFIALEKILNNYVKNIYSQNVTIDKENIYLKLDWLSDLETDILLIYELIKDYNFTFSDSKQIIESLGANKSYSGNVFLSISHKIILDRNQLIITQNKTNNNEFYLVTNNIETLQTQYNLLKFSIKNIKQVTIENNKNIVFLDLKKLKFPLKIRNWKDGDCFYPLGMSNKKKLSDFFIDNKLSILEKEKTLVIESNDKICWVVGLRIDDRFKITESTQEVFQIEIL